MILQTYGLLAEQKSFDTALLFRYIGKRTISNHQNGMRKAREMSNQDMAVDEEVTSGLMLLHASLVSINSSHSWLQIPPLP